MYVNACCMRDVQLNVARLCDFISSVKSLGCDWLATWMLCSTILFFPICDGKNSQCMWPVCTTHCAQQISNMRHVRIPHDSLHYAFPLRLTRRLRIFNLHARVGMAVRRHSAFSDCDLQCAAIASVVCNLWFLWCVAQWDVECGGIWRKHLRRCLHANSLRPF